nr:hypothetical protein [Mycoplasmopsis bovis]
MTGRQVLVGVPPKDENGKIEFPLSILGTISGEHHVLGSVVGTQNQDTKEALILGTKGIVYKIGRIISLDEVKRRVWTTKQKAS